MKGGFSLPVCVARSFLVWVAYNVFRIPYLTTGDFWAPLATFAINELIDICRRGLAMELLAHVKPSFLTEVRSSPFPWAITKNGELSHLITYLPTIHSHLRCLTNFTSLF